MSKLFVTIEAKMTLKIKSPTIKNLEHLLEINDFKGFCDEYENNEKYLQNNDISYAVSNIETPTIALPYVKFLLDKQIQSYSVVLLEYLVKHNFTKEFIDFLESIKDITLYAYDNKSVNIIKSICKNKNMKCFIYLVEKLPNSLPEFKNNDFIFKEIVKHNFHEGIDYLSQKIENIHLYLIDDIITKRSINKEAEINWDFYFHQMKIEEVSMSREQLKQSILDYAQSQYEINPNKVIVARIPKSSSSIINGTSSGIMPIIEPLRENSIKSNYYHAISSKSGSSKPSMPWSGLAKILNESKIEYADHKKNNISQSIWLNEKLKSELNTNNNISKSKKI